MELPNNIKEGIEKLGIDPNQSRLQLLFDLNDKELEIGYTEDWEITETGRDVERLYDAVYNLEDEPEG